MRSIVANHIHTWLRYLARWFLSLTLVWLVACASGPKHTEHAFEYHVTTDSPDVELLDYRYGDYSMTRVPEWQITEGRVRQGGIINGVFPRGDALYVKWRIKATGEIFEDIVDLKKRLPEDIARHRIYFVIKGSQLYVYLISPENLNPNPCPSREELRRLGAADSPDDRIFSMFCYRKITTIYPDKPKPQKSR